MNELQMAPAKTKSDRLLEIRRQIANGTYETTEKLAVAVDSLWRDLLADDHDGN